MTTAQILAGLPASATNARALIRQLDQIAQAIPSFREVLDNISPAHLARWTRELAAGRADDDLRDDILVYMVGTDRLMQLGINENTAQAIMLGGNEGGQNLGAVMQLPKVKKVLSDGAIDADDPVTDTPPVNVNGTKIPTGGRLIRVRAPKGSDADYLNYIVYNWNGVELAYEIGNNAQLNKLFGSIDAFDDVQVVNQAQFDSRDYLEVGMVGQIIGSTESLGSQIEREVRALGFEDMPSWMANSPEVLAMVAQATAQEWSSGRLWKSLSGTAAFKKRWGAVLPEYQQPGVTIGQAVAQIEADEVAMRGVLRPFLNGAVPLATIHSVLKKGWTPASVGQVFEAAETLRRDPQALPIANTILKRAGLATLNAAGFINAIKGVGPQATIEALNTATAARAMADAGIQLGNESVDLLMGLVDTSDRLLTKESWGSLAQNLSLNLIRFSRELDQSKLGIERDEIIAAAFGQKSPGGRTSGEVIDLLARFERDRRAAGEGQAGLTAFQNEQGRLQVQGVSGL